MKIRDTTRTTFEKLNPGDCFVYESVYYIKVVTIAERENSKVNAIQLTSGKPQNFANEALVQRPTVELVLS